MIQITKTSDKLTKKNIINRITDIPGGVSILLSTLVAGSIVLEGTPLSVPSSGKRTVCKQAKILAGSTTTAIKVDELTHNFKVGDYIGTRVGGKAYAISSITNASGVDTLNVGTAIDTPVTGDFIYQMSAQADGSDTTFNIAYDNGTCTGLTGDATSDALTVAPGKQGTVATIVGTIGAAGAGNAAVTVTSALLAAPEVLAVAVANNDTNLIVATKIRAALMANANIAAKFIVGGFNDKVTLTTIEDITLTEGAALSNAADVIIKEAFQVPSSSQVIWVADAFLRADVVEGCIGSEYLATLDVKEVKY